MIMLKTPSAKATSKIVKKYGNKVSISNSYLKGDFTIKNFRTYDYACEVDISFKGEILVSYAGKKQWYSSSIMGESSSNGRRVSKIKVNRFLKRNMFFEVKTYLKYFDVDLVYYDLIKKINWI